ncbi:MAG: ABC transporter substrate-binding protein [Deltaproteobacteria bacterium]|nr:ABC transporter substrate-binding protein [Deltaproteobacteria bacterium]
MNLFYRKLKLSNRVPVCKIENPTHSPSIGVFAIAILVLTATFTIGLTPARAQSNARAATQEFVNQALQILRDKDKSAPQKRRELKPLIEARFDATAMARSSLGYHWRSLSPDERTSFTQVFTNFIEAAYLDKVQDYSGQQVQFGQSRSLGEGYAAVDTTIVQTGKSPIPVTYLLEQSGSGWKIYDVAVDNISIIANYRNQFNRVINQQGFPKLMADLRAKSQQLGAELGQG